jgi:hypothetical protein
MTQSSEAPKNTTPYGYLFLERESSEIRILTLLPGSWDEEIHCRLRKASLDLNPEYEALSYAWGDLLHTKHIHLDGHTIEVTSNLEVALRYLRRPSEELSLWVDALCIDQSDDSEKSHQVALMDKVYKQCSQVYIWLGHIESDPPISQIPVKKGWKNWLHCLE